MKSFKNFAALCMALLCASVNPVLAFNIANIDKSNEDISSLGSTSTTTRPKADCSTCNTNVLINPSFEDNDHFNGWTKSSGWGIDGTYAVCGDDAAVLQNNGSIYQDVQVVPNTEVSFSIWGGYHKAKSQTFKLSFLDADKKVITSTIQSKVVDWDVDTAPSNVPILKKYSFTGTAPANAVFVRAEATAAEGDWFKVDGACMTLKAPAVECSCDGNVLKNPSFEDGTTNSWTKSGTWNANNYYVTCGDKAQVLTGAGNIYQEVAVVPGAFVNFSMFGGYHKERGQKFKLSFYNGSTLLASTSVDVDWDVDLVPSGQPILKKYTLNGTAPANTKTVRVEAISASGDYFKIDGACLTVTVPVCETCNDNKMTDPSFEAGTGEWTKTGGTFETAYEYVVCGSKSGKVTGKSTLSLEKSADPAATVTFSIYAGVSAVNGQKLRLRFLNIDRGEISTKETPVTKIYSAAAVGLQKFTVSERAPQNTRFVSVELVSNGETLIFDLGCLSITSGTPLPVTLTEFAVKKEGNSASLVWATTMETNSKEFEVQHSLNGKQWEILGVVVAQGESNIIKSYSFSHAAPANGNNLYRLRMIDQDLTFAYSRIVNENFVTEESAVLYPNPSSNFMKLKTGVEKIASIQIYDVKGMKVKDFSPSGSDIDISSLAQGTYIVTFKQKSGLVTKQRIQVVR